MSLTYAGIGLSPLTPDLAVICDRWWRREAPDLWTRPGYQVGSADHLPIPAPPPPEPVRLNTLYWPNGASRWATLHSLVGGVEAAAILTAIDPNAPTAKPLVISDEENGSLVTTDMHLIGARPVFVAGAANQRLWWITLVDQRYFWWQKSHSSYSLDSESTWAQLLTRLVTLAAGTAPSLPSISAEYGAPNYNRWKPSGTPVPLLIDAAASVLGLRFIRRLDGSTEFVTATAARIADEALFNAYADEVALGGRNDVTDVTGNIPSTVTVTGPRGNTIRTVSLSSLSLSAYGDATGVDAGTAYVAGDLETGSDEYAELQAEAYYLWALSLTDATFRSVIDWEPSGLEDRIEWEYMPGREAAYRTTTKNLLDVKMPWERVLTRVVRRDWADRNVYSTPKSYQGFEAELTSSWSESTGYSWKKLELTGGSAPPMFADASPSVTGNRAISFVDDKKLLSGKQGWLEPNPDGDGQGYIFIHTPGSPIDGSGCDWLAMDLAKTKCLKLTVLRAAGRCACISTTQEFQLVYSSSDGGWVGAEDFKTCCGCTWVKLTHNSTTHVASLSFITTYKSCKLGNVASYQLTDGVCVENKVIFIGNDFKNCNDDTVDGCSDVFVVQLECVDCDIRCDCDDCPRGAVAAWAVPNPNLGTEGFGDQPGCGSYNHPWTLKHVSGCAYAATCGDDFVQLTRDSTHYILDFGNRAIYKIPIAEWSCCGPNTLTLESEICGPSTAESVTITRIGDCGCGNCPNGQAQQFTVTFPATDDPTWGPMSGFAYTLNRLDGDAAPCVWYRDADGDVKITLTVTSSTTATIMAEVEGATASWPVTGFSCTAGGGTVGEVTVDVGEPPTPEAPVGVGYACPCQGVQWNPAWNGQNYWFCTSTTGSCDETECQQLNEDPGEAVCICDGPFDTLEECEEECLAGGFTLMECTAGLIGLQIPNNLEIEFFDTFGGATCLEGAIYPITNTPPAMHWRADNVQLCAGSSSGSRVAFIPSCGGPNHLLLYYEGSSFPWKTPPCAGSAPAISAGWAPPNTLYTVPATDPYVFAGGQGAEFVLYSNTVAGFPITCPLSNTKALIRMRGRDSVVPADDCGKGVGSPDCQIIVIWNIEYSGLVPRTYTASWQGGAPDFLQVNVLAEPVVGIPAGVIAVLFEDGEWHLQTTYGGGGGGSDETAIAGSCGSFSLCFEGTSIDGGIGTAGTVGANMVKVYEILP